MPLWVLCVLCFCGGVLFDMIITTVVTVYKKRKLKEAVFNKFLKKED